MILATVTSGHLSDMFGGKPMIVTGLLLQGGCLYAYTVFPSIELISLIGLLEGLGRGMTLTSSMVLLSEFAPSKSKGAAIGTYRTFMGTGGFIGPLLCMTVLSMAEFHYTFISAILVLALDTALILTIRSKKRAGVEQVSNDSG